MHLCSRLALLPLMVGALSGCARLMPGSPLPAGFSIRELAKADDGSPFAASRSGGFATVAKGELQVIDAAGVGREIAEIGASALCYSPSGERLAAAVPEGDGSRLRLFDRQGTLAGAATVAGRVTSLVWRSESQLLAATLDIGPVASGSRLRSRLYLWNGSTAPSATTLSEVTVPGAELPQKTLSRTLSLALSPYGDEIAYSSLKNRPLFSPYQGITVRHLESGAEHEVGRTSVGSGGPIYMPDGESLLVGDSGALTRRLSIPDGREMDAWPSPGSYPAISPSGSYLFLDGGLYENGRSVLSFPSRARGLFLPDGSGLLLSYGGKLYLVSGLKEPPAPKPPADPERLLRLRRLRSLGLISEREYKKEKGGN